MSGQAPLVNRLTVPVPAAAAAADDSTAIARAPFAGVVTAVHYAPEAAITGAATNSRSVVLRNRGAAGTGTTEMARLDFVAGVNAAAFDEVVLTLNATAANRAFAEGDILEWFSDSVGTGLADPGGLATIEFSRS